LHWTYDDEADALYIYLVDEIPPGAAVRQLRRGHGVLVDLDASGQVLGIEVLDASMALSNLEPMSVPEVDREFLRILREVLLSIMSPSVAYSTGSGGLIGSAGSPVIVESAQPLVLAG
jgi:uncharacterized protein YuzE